MRLFFWLKAVREHQGGELLDNLVFGGLPFLGKVFRAEQFDAAADAVGQHGCSHSGHGVDKLTFPFEQI